MAEPDEILKFWLDDVGPKGWYGGGDELDAEIRDRFMDDYEKARSGELSLWQTHARGALAFIILTDQFPRNMFRGDAQAFATDEMARSVAKAAISRGWDLKIPEPGRQFFYMPMMHAECQVDQDRAVRLILTRMPETGQENLPHARVHREIIRRFGRFPYRNEALGRTTKPAEREWMENGGYGAELREIQNEAA